MPLSPRLYLQAGVQRTVWSLGGISRVVVSPVSQRSAPVTPLSREEVGLGLEAPGMIPSGEKQ